MRGKEKLSKYLKLLIAIKLSSQSTGGVTLSCAICQAQQTVWKRWAKTILLLCFDFSSSNINVQGHILSTGEDALYWWSCLPACSRSVTLPPGNGTGLVLPAPLGCITAESSSSQRLPQVQARLCRRIKISRNPWSFHASPHVACAYSYGSLECSSPKTDLHNFRDTPDELLNHENILTG